MELQYNRLKKKLCQYVDEFWIKFHPLAKEFCEPIVNERESDESEQNERFINYLNFFSLPGLMIIQITAFFVGDSTKLYIFGLFFSTTVLILLSFLIGCRKKAKIYKTINTLLMTIS